MKKNDPSADEIMAALGRKLSKVSKAITKRKLESGEYVMYNGKAVPAYLLKEQENKNGKD